jgi:hypothetical protein
VNPRQRVQRPWARLGSVIVGAVLLAGCGSASSGSAPVDSGYVAGNGTDAVVFQLSRTGNSVSGEMQWAEAKGAPPAIQSGSVPVSGTIEGTRWTSSGDAVQIEFGYHRYVGTISASTLSLNMPQSDGSLALHQFHIAPLSQFNSDVATINRNASAADRAVANQQSVTSAAFTVTSDMSTIQGDVSAVNGDLSSIASDLVSEGQDLSTTQQDFQTVQTEAAAHPGGTTGQVCADVNQVHSDASEVNSDARQMASDLSGLSSDMKQMQSDLSTLESDWETLSSAVTADPGYTPSGGSPSASSVEALKQSATSGLANAASRANAAVATANTEQQNAYQTSQTAAAIHGCGGSSYTPTPIGFSSPVSTGG